MRLVIAFLLVVSNAVGQTIKRAEYYFDTDPGKGNGTSISVAQGASINETHSVSVSSLSNGPHSFSMRVLDSNGTWSQSSTRTFFIVTPVITVNASTIKKAEYFFDNDPGLGSGTPLPISSAGTENNSFVISTGSLTPGFHQVCIRYQDDLGRWSEFAQRTFYVVPIPSATNSTVLKKVEYFFDNDPGIGQGVSLPISASGSENNLFTIDISSLSVGFHQLAVRYRDDQGKWTHFVHRTFYIVPPTNLNANTKITKTEYFFDSDPGQGNGTSLPIPTSSTENNLFSVNIGSLAPGFHQLAMRYKDDKGHWSLFTNRTFYIVPPAGVALSTAIKKAEYFFDTDPGTGHGTPLTLSPSTSPDNVFALDVSALAKGFHQLMIRYQDDKGRWSTFSQRTFYIFPGTIVTTTLQKVEYFIDVDPGINKATPLAMGAAPTLDQVFAIDLGTTPPGNHVLYVRTKDSNGNWSYPVSSATFSIATCTVPTPPLGTNGSRCDAGSVTISAAGAAGGQQYRWYNDGTTNTIAFTGPSYSTPSLNVSTDYYASVFDPSTACESNRTKISAVVVALPKPVLNPSGSLTLCQGNNLTVTAPVGFASYAWSNTASTQSITTATSAIYTVTVGDGNCTSPASDPLVLTVVPRPAKPIVQALSSTIVCGNGSVTLAAPTGGASYLWSSGETTQQITASSTSSYAVQITDTNHCQSVSSDPIAVQILPIPNKPVVDVVGSSVLCKNGSTILSAPASFSKYLWSTGDTTAQIIVSSPGNYSVKVGTASCMSVSSDALTIALANQLTKPIVQVNGSTIICGSGSVSLSGPLGASKYLWSNGDTTRQTNISATGSYSVQVTDANNCQSISSDQVNVQVLPLPSNPVITPLTSTVLCKNSSLILSAPIGFSRYRWSNGDTTAQTIITSAGNYTVKVGNAVCFSGFSLASNITLAPTQPRPVIQVIGSLSICGSGSVTLKAPAASAYLWSDGSTGQTVSPTTAGKYSVVVTDANNCLSDASDQEVVQVVSIPGAPTITAYGATVLCNDASVILSAPPGFLKYKWSSGDTTAQVLTSSDGNYTVQTGYASNCLSAASPQVAIRHTGQPCTGAPDPKDVPPSIANAIIAVPVGTAVTFGLLKLIKKSDYGAGVNYSTLRIAFPLTNGTDALITANDSLWINFKGTNYVGLDSIGIQVCDSLGSCTERTLTIKVVAQIEVFNAVSPFADGLNDFLNLKYIDKIDDTKKNKVTIVDRWGNEVFSVSDYDNVERVFRGNDNSGKELPSGTYYYRIDFDSGRPTLSGFLSLKR
ncbi:MAG TPA: gliding motility-associated C-terminal domain-containing protein [Cyclobacteriaceae bacterium]|jgi:gliding motility-associated-like protein|nr:gliding motility-associated C-terminal domain-containing protein [Cyclobacteriaceae bacterium]